MTTKQAYKLAWQWIRIKESLAYNALPYNARFPDNLLSAIPSWVLGEAMKHYDYDRRIPDFQALPPFYIRHWGIRTNMDGKYYLDKEYDGVPF